MPNARFDALGVPSRHCFASHGHQIDIDGWVLADVQDEAASWAGYRLTIIVSVNGRYFSRQQWFYGDPTVPSRVVLHEHDDPIELRCMIQDDSKPHGFAALRQACIEAMERAPWLPVEFQWR